MILTNQMLRDLIGIHGPQTIKGLAKLLKMQPRAFKCGTQMSIILHMI